MNERNGYIDILKWLAIITMTIDHLGIMFFDNNEVMRTIGRLAFPLFAYLIAMGMINTSNRKVYLKRMFVFAAISQIPYYVMFNEMVLNVLFTFLLPMLFIYFFEEKKYVGIGIVLILMLFVPVSYGLYGIAITLIFYFFYKKKLWLAIGFSLATIIYTIGWAADYQIYGIAVLMCMLNDVKIKEIKWLKTPKYTFYIYYPLHMLILVGLEKLI